MSPLELLRKPSLFFRVDMMLVKQVNRWCSIEPSRKSQDVRKYTPLTRVRSDPNMPSPHSKWAPWNYPSSICSFQTATVNSGVMEAATDSQSFYINTAALWRQLLRVISFLISSVYFAFMIPSF